MNIIKTEMLIIADNLESKADDAHMDHDDVRMTPREVHELADDIKAFVLESDRPTCEDTGDNWTFHCSACGCELDLEDREGEPTMWLGGSPMTPRHCPNCAAVVADTLDASKVDGK